VKKYVYYFGTIVILVFKKYALHLLLLRKIERVSETFEKAPDVGE
jgi:hypothetical protein